MPLPVWVVTELLTFGSAATLLANMKQSQKNLIAALTTQAVDTALSAGRAE